MEEIKHDAKMDSNKPQNIMHDGTIMHGSHHKPWQNNWKSPVSLGIFLATATLALVFLMYAFSLFGAVLQSLRPAQSQGLSQQELQQLMQSSSQSGAPTGTAAH